MGNDLFWKALRLLAHPASVGAMATLLVNDHLLRRLWPSWWTGKLGDFAWLFFMPFVAAALIALIAGRRARNVGALACLLIGGVFALAKTVPAAHAAVIVAASILFGFPVGWRRDPTDLIALVSVVAAWLMWDADGRRTARRSGGFAPTRPFGWGIPLLAAAMLLTVANSPAPERGIQAVVRQDNVLVACSTYGSYGSADGGFTWTSLIAPTPIPHPTLPDGVTPTAGPTPTALPTPTLEPGAPTPIPYALSEVCRMIRSTYQTVIQGRQVAPAGPTPTQEPTPAPGEATPTPGPTATPPIYQVRGERDDVFYRFQAENRIERSVDGGNTWTTEYNLGAPGDARPETPQPRGIEALFEAALALAAQKGQSRIPGPLGGMADPETGRVFFSMGVQGILMRDVDGGYRWIPVGDYRR